MTREEALIKLSQIDELIERAEALKAGAEARERKLEAQIQNARARLQALKDRQRELDTAHYTCQL
jgi:hypothetical protein